MPRVSAPLGQERSLLVQIALAKWELMKSSQLVEQVGVTLDVLKHKTDEYSTQSFTLTHKEERSWELEFCFERERENKRR